jgi:hypothetical protein
MSLRGGTSRRRVAVLVPFLAVCAVGVLTPSLANAHFKINSPASWMSQDSLGGPQKNGPCAATANTALGDSSGTATNAVSVLEAGQIVPVSITATVAHPGWFRIALVEGASSTQTLSTIADPKAQTGTNCTPAIVKNPEWSLTQPILANGLPAGSTASTQQTGTQTFQVTIPKSATCTSVRPCTLQVIMVMTDHPANDCYYHHCADISTGPTTDAGGDLATTDAFVTRDASNGVRDANTVGGNGGSGGASGSGGAGSGGVTGAGGSGGEGGVASQGGNSGSGGATDSGGSTGWSGGVTSTGAITGRGGTTGSGAGVGSAGSMGSGGVSGRGGSTGAGGLTGAGGSAGSGGGVRATGSSGATGTGAGAGGEVKAGPGCGCDLSSRGGASWGMVVAMVGAMAALRRRWRRR